MNMKSFSLFVLLIVLITVSSCTHEALLTPAEPPSNLVYLPDSLAMQAGTAVNSAQPSLAGTGPFTFNVSSMPLSLGNITINEMGIISASSNLATGKYVVTVVVNNVSGSVSFPDVYKVRVYNPPQPPSLLVYIPSSVSILAGTSFTSSSPGIQGTAPFTFSLVNNPAPGRISIDNQGIVNTTAALAAGSYVLNIQVTNSGGSQTFNNALTINVTNTASPPSSLAYSANSMTINAGSSVSSVNPNISGTSPFTFSLTAAPDAGTSLTINNFGVITTTSSLAVGTYKISVTVTNSAGTATFPDIYTITVSKVITFNNDIKPLITQNCATCHTAGPQTIYTNYTNASRDVNLILDRVQRAQGSAGFMPKNGSPLTTVQIQLLKDWLAQGLLP